MSPLGESLEKRLADLTAAFSDPALKSIPLSVRKPITDRLEQMLDQAIALIQPDLVIEIGAHEAAFARKMKTAYPDTQVIAIEANPRVHDHYAQKAIAQGVVYRNLAVDAVAGQVSLFIPEVVAGREKPHVNMMASLMEIGTPDSVMTEIKVEAVTLDSLAADFTGDRAVLWVDVEGAVDRVIMGGPNMLRRTALFYCEVESLVIWKGQKLASSVSTAMLAAGFTAIARDCPKWRQHNVLYVRNDLLQTPGLQDLAADYCAEALTAFVPAPQV